MVTTMRGMAVMPVIAVPVIAVVMAMMSVVIVTMAVIVFCRLFRKFSEAPKST